MKECVRHRRSGDRDGNGCDEVVFGNNNFVADVGCNHSVDDNHYYYFYYYRRYHKIDGRHFRVVIVVALESVRRIVVDEMIEDDGSF